jgi:hypothetical protein
VKEVMNYANVAAALSSTAGRKAKTNSETTGTGL